MNRKLRQCNKPLIKYALEEFKSIFGTVGEEALSKNLLETESELLQVSEDILLHRKTYFDDSTNQVIILSISSNSNSDSFTLIISEPELSKTHKFPISYDQCFTRREIAYMELDSLEVLKKAAIKLIDERILLDRSEDGQYKITVLTTEDIENRRNAEDEESVSENEHQEVDMDDKEKSDGVKTIIEEAEDPHSESVHN